MDCFQSGPALKEAPRATPTSISKLELSVEAVYVVPARGPPYFLCVGIRVARWPVFQRPGRYFTANLAETGKKPVF